MSAFGGKADIATSGVISAFGESGKSYKHPFTRQLTQEIGHPKLREHLASVTTIMKLSEEYDDFAVKLDRVHPRYGTTMQLPFPNDDEAAN